MAIEEAIYILIEKDKLNKKSESVKHLNTSIALKYLFDCYNRVEVEEREYPKVKSILLKTIVHTNFFYCL